MVEWLSTTKGGEKMDEALDIRLGAWALGVGAAVWFVGRAAKSAANAACRSEEPPPLVGNTGEAKITGRNSGQNGGPCHICRRWSHCAPDCPTRE